MRTDVSGALGVVLVLGVLGAAQRAEATPSTTFWTPSTGYVQPYLVPHLTYDTYVGEAGATQNDYGLTIGVLPFEKLQAEIGLDVFYPGFTTKNLYLSGKLTIPENAYGVWQPALSVGIQSVGFEADLTDYDVIHANVAKTLPLIGNLSLGAYYGLNDKLMVSSKGKKQQGGLMAAWTSPDIVLDLPGLQKVVFLADVQTGKNAFGAVGAGIGLYFHASDRHPHGPGALSGSQGRRERSGSPGLAVVDPARRGLRPPQEVLNSISAGPGGCEPGPPELPPARWAGASGYGSGGAIGIRTQPMALLAR